MGPYRSIGLKRRGTVEGVVDVKGGFDEITTIPEGIPKSGGESEI